MAGHGIAGSLSSIECGVLGATLECESRRQGMLCPATLLKPETHQWAFMRVVQARECVTTLVSGLWRGPTERCSSSGRGPTGTVFICSLSMHGEGEIRRILHTRRRMTGGGKKGLRLFFLLPFRSFLPERAWHEATHACSIGRRKAGTLFQRTLFSPFHFPPPFFPRKGGKGEWKEGRSFSLRNSCTPLGEPLRRL